MCFRSRDSPSGVALTSLRPASVKHHLSPHFTELKLADIVSAYLGNPFISTWQVGTQYVHLGNEFLDEKDELKTHAMHITLPLDADGTYDFTVDWGDGSSAHIVSHDQAEVKHTYGCKGEYTLQLNGIVKGFGFGSHGDDDESHPCSQQIMDISQWGCVGLEKRGGFQFSECAQLRMSASDAPDLTRMTNMSSMFFRASSFNGDVSQWNTGSVTNMGSMFFRASSFNGNISGWNMIALTHDRARIYHDSARG